MREPPLKKILYWCPECDLPLLGNRCICGATGDPVPLLRPYDVRPALGFDREMIASLLKEKYGTDRIPEILLLNKTGGLDRNDLIIAHGMRFGWLTFDPVLRRYDLDLSAEALHFLIHRINKGIVDISTHPSYTSSGHLTGKSIDIEEELPDGYVIIRAKKHYGVGTLNGKRLKIRQLLKEESGKEYKNPSWKEAILANRKHLKNIEHNAVRSIRIFIRDRKRCNVAYSGGKDSTVVRELARRAGIEEIYSVNTGLEFPETEEFLDEDNIRIISPKDQFWKDIWKRGPPRKDSRWCCESLKLEPVKKEILNSPCVTIQGTRWYESFARSVLPEAQKNPFCPDQLNYFPIRNWRAIEVFFYIWWRDLPLNPLYEKGFERVGCWLCPAMLESEWERVRELHPKLYAKWHSFLVNWAKSKGIDPETANTGLWRWENPPAKMRNLSGEQMSDKSNNMRNLRKPFIKERNLKKMPK